MGNDDKATAPARSRQRTKPRSEIVSPSLESLQQLEAFQAANAHVFPSVPSLRWFYRQHRQELTQAGAVVELAGRLLINAPVFAAQAVAIGARAASARAER